MNFRNDAGWRRSRFAACFLFAAPITVAASSVQAAEQCRFIEARLERDACYQRQETARATRQKALETQQAAQPTPYEPMTPEDAQMTKAIRGICRGC
jgi:hypothetical protein